VTPVRCDASERELLLFLLAGSLSAAESEVVLAHVAGCAACAEELAASRVLVEGLRDQHLTSEEVVAAAWDGGHDSHLAVCPRCRSEVDELRSEVGRLAPRDAPAGARAWPPALLAAAASVAVVVTATVLYRMQPTVEPFPPPRPTATDATPPTLTPAATSTPIAATPVPTDRLRDPRERHVALRNVQTVVLEISREGSAAEIDRLLRADLSGVVAVIDDASTADAVLRGVVSSLGETNVRIDHVRVINAAGDVLWPSPKGARYEGTPSDVSARIARDLRAARQSTPVTAR
jgi:hypothetical protein